MAEWRKRGAAAETRAKGDREVCALVEGTAMLDSRIATIETHLVFEGLELIADRTRSTLIVRTSRGEAISHVDWRDRRSSARIFKDHELLEVFIAPEGIVVTAACALR